MSDDHMGGGSMDPIWTLVVIVIVGYVLSILLHPYAKCDRCKGLGRHPGSLFTYSLRPCHRCNGTGRKQRIGALLLGRGKRQKPTSRIQPPSRYS
jgi:DnaJ-class molecular chaperone